MLVRGGIHVWPPPAVVWVLIILLVVRVSSSVVLLVVLLSSSVMCLASKCSVTSLVAVVVLWASCLLSRVSRIVLLPGFGLYAFTPHFEGLIDIVIGLGNGQFEGFVVSVSTAYCSQFFHLYFIHVDPNVLVYALL